MPSDTSPADFEVHVFCSWGQKAQVQRPCRRTDAPMPSRPSPSILLVKTNDPMVDFTPRKPISI
jgi:hypothetical protein